VGASEKHDAAFHGLTPNQALRLAQRIIRAEARRLPTVEVAYGQQGEHPDVRGLRRAADLIEPLIDPGEEP
jgi:hypothetical protein